MNKSSIITFFLFFCLTSLFLVTPSIPMITVTPSSIDSSSTSNLSRSSISTPLVPRALRVAIYNEPNLTTPAYDNSFPILSNSYVEIQNILSAAGHLTTLLTMDDIQNHALKTADYDVFVLPDTEPRENITNYVFEFWLGGGGLLCLDSCAAYLCYMGILPPEAAGTDGEPGYWTWVADGANITARHPVSKNYNLYDTFSTPTYWYATWDWSALMPSKIFPDLTKVAQYGSNPNEVTVLAFDPSDRGGRVVHMWWDGKTDPLPAIHQMVVDACDWLYPRPKGRIVFDLSHIPYYGVDPWDDMATYPNEFSTLRNALVNRSYTFDKLWPSATGNFTAANLAPYDLLILMCPSVNYTAAEVAAVTNWIQNGGSLLAMGDNHQGSVYYWNEYLNYLLSNIDLCMNNTASGLISPLTYTWSHPTLEPGLSQLCTGGYGYVNYTGTAYPIWGEHVSNVIVGAQDFGNGRVFLIGDVNPFDNTYLDDYDNYQYAINVVNWLTAATADVLIYVDGHPSVSDPNDNPYRGPVALALNDLGVSFYLTFNSTYFNMSLVEGTWNLVVIDNPYWTHMFDGGGYYGYTSEILDYAMSGGHLIISTWEYLRTESNALWDFLGFQYNSNWMSPPPFYVWDASHDIFNQPNHYGTNSFMDAIDFVGIDWSNVTVYANGTAIAGLILPASNTNAMIVVGNNGQTITNTMLLTDYNGDTDDSTYSDSLEIWENEIAYLLRPSCIYTPTVPVTKLGSTMTVTLDLQNLGLRPAYGGYVTISVPAGLGTLSTPATQFFSSPLDPSGTDTLTWQIDVTGVGDHTLDFTAGFDGLPGTTYTDTLHASAHAFGTFDVTTNFNPGDTVVMGTPITVSLTVFDDLSLPVTDATINVTIDSTIVTFSHSGSGIYEGTIDTATLTPSTYSLGISIQKTNFNTYTGSHTITVQAAPFIPGFPPLAIAVGTVIAVGTGLISHRRKLNKV